MSKPNCTTPPNVGMKMTFSIQLTNLKDVDPVILGNQKVRRPRDYELLNSETRSYDWSMKNGICNVMNINRPLTLRKKASSYDLYQFPTWGTRSCTNPLRKDWKIERWKQRSSKCKSSWLPWACGGAWRMIAELSGRTEWRSVQTLGRCGAAPKICNSATTAVKATMNPQEALLLPSSGLLYFYQVHFIWISVNYFSDTLEPFTKEHKNTIMSRVNWW